MNIFKIINKRDKSKTQLSDVPYNCWFLYKGKLYIRPFGASLNYSIPVLLFGVDGMIIAEVMDGCYDVEMVDVDIVITIK